MPIAYEGSDGQGHTGYTKYPAEKAKVIPNGGNDAIHDHVVVATEKITDAPKQGSYDRAKGE